MGRSAREGLKGLARGKLVPLDPEVLGPSSDSIDPVEGAEAVLEREQEAEQLRRVLAQLPSRQQEILELHGKGMKFADIARALGVSRAAVTQAVDRARAAFRRKFAP